MSKKKIQELIPDFRMTTPESRDKLDSTLTPRLPNLHLKLRMKEESSFGVCITSEG